MPVRDLATIRLVTERHRELQGLHLTLVGAVLVTMSAVYMTGALPRDFPGGIVGLLACLVHTFTGEYLTHYYATRFGRVDQRGASAWVVRTLFLTGLGLAVALPSLGGRVGLMFVPFTLMHSWIVVRDSPRRNHHVIGAAGALIALANVGLETRLNEGLLMQAGFVLGSAWVIVGLLDHRMLALLRGETPNGLSIPNPTLRRKPPLSASLPAPSASRPAPSASVPAPSASLPAPSPSVPRTLRVTSRTLCVSPRTLSVSSRTLTVSSPHPLRQFPHPHRQFP